MRTIRKQATLRQTTVGCCDIHRCCVKNAGHRRTMAGFEDYRPKTKAQNFAPLGAILFRFRNF